MYIICFTTCVLIATNVCGFCKMKLYSKVKYKIVVAFIRDISRWERQNDEERETRKFYAEENVFNGQWEKTGLFCSNSLSVQVIHSIKIPKCFELWLAISERACDRALSLDRCRKIQEENPDEVMNMQCSSHTSNQLEMKYTLTLTHTKPESHWREPHIIIIE